MIGYEEIALHRKNIHVERDPGRPLTFADTRGEPILTYDAEETASYDGGPPAPRGWVLNVEHYQPFAMGVRDFDSVGEALQRAISYLKSPLPNASRLPGRSAKLQDERRDDGSCLNVNATLERDGSLTIAGHDLGPVAESISPDGEYEWFYSIAAHDVPALVVALGGQPGADVIDVLTQRWSGDAAYRLGAAVRSSGVEHRFSSYP
jgi:hypothetical protein